VATKLSSPEESESLCNPSPNGFGLLTDRSSSGIGRATAVLFAREGSDVSIVYLPEEQPDAEDTKKMVEKEGRECLLIPGDLMDNETCRKAVEKHVEKFGKIHVLVNNASKQIMCEKFEDIDLDNVESTFRSNILQMFAITKYALPHMEKGGS
jgi:NAD(P)-dependent dehydrogenase (short-subunit alcohol dehydrogenase family)